jgi:hypothetical protein
MKSILLAVAAFTLFAAVSVPSYAQDATTKDQLIGTWKVETVKATTGGKPSYPLGEQPTAAPPGWAPPHAAALGDRHGLLSEALKGQRLPGLGVGQAVIAQGGGQDPPAASANLCDATAIVDKRGIGADPLSGRGRTIDLRLQLRLIRHQCGLLLRLPGYVAVVCSEGLQFLVCQVLQSSQWIVGLLLLVLRASPNAIVA